MFNDDTRNHEMARIAAMGVKGIKVDFFATDKQIAIDFLKEVPVIWDELRVLAAIPGELFVVARRNGKKWYVAGINGKKEHQEVQIEMPFSMNSPLLFADGETISEFSIQTLNGNINSVRVKMIPGGGFVLY